MSHINQGLTQRKSYKLFDTLKDRLTNRNPLLVSTQYFHKLGLEVTWGHIQEQYLIPVDGWIVKVGWISYIVPYGRQNTEL